MTLYSLLKHLQLCHARFNFIYHQTPSGVRVDVSINELFDGSYSGSPHDLVGPAGSAFARTGPVRRTIVTRILVCHPRRPKPSLTEFLEIDENEVNSQRPYITGHNRLYHHTITCLPVHPKELDNDSEDESDPAWLRHKTMQMIDEFTDVNEGEKELMKMWNLHMMRKGYVGDIQIQLACERFLKEHGEELLRKNLYRNFILHLCNLFDYGLLSPEMLCKTVEKLQLLLVKHNECRQVILTAGDTQKDYWKRIGVHKQQPTLPSTPQHKRKAPQATVTSEGTKRDLDAAQKLVEQVSEPITEDDRTKRDAKSRFDFDDQKLRVIIGPVLKKITKADINSNESTIISAKDETKKDKVNVSGANKRKALPLHYGKIRVIIFILVDIRTGRRYKTKMFLEIN